MLAGLPKASLPKSFQNGRYLVRQLLGKGSSGSVYEVLDQELREESIALKVLHPHLLSDPSTLERFRVQVLLARQLSHPNIVQVHDFDRDDEGNHFITMELVDGVSLSTLFRNRKSAVIPFDEILEILSDTAAALAHAHHLGIIHRDLKPSNLLVSHEGVVKLSDFGLAKGLEYSFGLTQTGELLGSPAYTAPEQFRGEQIDARADVYSFGMVAYELISGKPAFEGGSYLEQVEAHLTQDLPALRDPNGAPLPLWVLDFISKCAAKESRRRYKDGSELQSILNEHLPESKRGEQTSLRFTFLKYAQSPKTIRRKRWFSAFAIATLLLITWTSAIQRNTRVFIGSWILRAERLLGVELVPLKAPFLIHVSPLRPDDFFWEVSQNDPTHSNIPAYLDAGGPINVTDSEGNTLLHSAVHNVESGYITDLIHSGLDPNRRNNKGETPLLHALRIRQTSAAINLTREKANPNLCDNNQVCPFHVAVENADTTFLYHFLRTGADVYLPNAEGETMFHVLAKRHALESIKTLFAMPDAYQWNVDTRTPRGQTPLMLAVGTDDNEQRLIGILDAFLKQGARVSTRDNECKTPLLHALTAGSISAIQFLLEHGADPLDKDCQGKSAKQYAEEKHLAHLSPKWSEP